MEEIPRNRYKVHTVLSLGIFLNSLEAPGSLHVSIFLLLKMRAVRCYGLTAPWLIHYSEPHTTYWSLGDCVSQNAQAYWQKAVECGMRSLGEKIWLYTSSPLISRTTYGCRGVIKGMCCSEDTLESDWPLQTETEESSRGGMRGGVTLFLFSPGFIRSQIAVIIERGFEGGTCSCSVVPGRTPQVKEP